MRLNDQWLRRSNRAWRRSVRWQQVAYQVMVHGKERYCASLLRASRKRAMIDAPRPTRPLALHEVQEAQDSDSSYADSLPTPHVTLVYDDLTMMILSKQVEGVHLLDI